MNNYRSSRFVLFQVRRLYTSNSLKIRKNHYDSLGVSKNASQADVKTAYYKLSKVYHPDKNQGRTAKQCEEHAKKFRDITEAYEVLGNDKTRKMYDRGLVGVSFPPHPTYENPTPNFYYKASEFRTRPPPFYDQNPFYKFDDRPETKYEESIHSFHRSREIRRRREFYASVKQARNEAYNLHIIIWGIFSCVTFICLIFQMSSDYDVVKVKRSTKGDRGG